MKLAAVSMIKNESDILELFVRVNSRVFDAIFIVDHSSNDSSAAIAAAMRRCGFDVRYALWSDPAYQQSRAITWAVNAVARTGDFDYIVPLDADEFLSSEGSDVRDIIAREVPLNGHGRMPWRTYCPLTGDFHGLAAPLFDDFRLRSSEPKQFYKVILGRDFARGCSVAMGSHRASNGPDSQPPVELPLVLQHAPVRSPEQIIKKALMGNYAFALKADRKPNEGYHWDVLVRRIRESGYVVDLPLLQQLALDYAAPPEGAPAAVVVEDGPRIGRPGDAIEFPLLARQSPLAALDRFTSTLIEGLRPQEQALRSFWPWTRKARRHYAPPSSFGHPPGSGPQRLASAA